MNPVHESFTKPTMMRPYQESYQQKQPIAGGDGLGQLYSRDPSGMIPYDPSPLSVPLLPMFPFSPAVSSFQHPLSYGQHQDPMQFPVSPYQFGFGPPWNLSPLPWDENGGNFPVNHAKGQMKFKPSPASAAAVPSHHSGPPLVDSPVAPEPTKQYLAQAAEQPKPLASPQPLLVILDLNGTLGFRKSRNNMNFQKRRDLTPFLKTLLSKFKVMIWSSSRPVTVDIVCRNIFKGVQRKALVAEWGRDKLGLTEAQYSEKVQVYKRLEAIWADIDIQMSYPQGQDGGKWRWDQSNTILVDDSKLKAASEPFNILEVPEYTGGIEERVVLIEVLAKLDILAKFDDVSKLLRHWSQNKPGAFPSDGILPAEPVAVTRDEMKKLRSEVHQRDEERKTDPSIGTLPAEPVAATRNETKNLRNGVYQRDEDWNTQLRQSTLTKEERKAANRERNRLLFLAARERKKAKKEQNPEGKETNEERRAANEERRRINLEQRKETMENLLSKRKRRNEKRKERKRNMEVTTIEPVQQMNGSTISTSLQDASLTASVKPAQQKNGSTISTSLQDTTLTADAPDAPRYSSTPPQSSSPSSPPVNLDILVPGPQSPSHQSPPSLTPLVGIRPSNISSFASRPPPPSVPAAQQPQPQPQPPLGQTSSAKVSSPNDESGNFLLDRLEESLGM